ncbi:hypothetical protein RCL1_002198 [Eukaryota sp. TZLM3-RCL]
MKKVFQLIESFVEPLLRKLAENEDDDSSGQRRAHVTIPSSNRLHFVDVGTVDVCESTADKFCFSETSPLEYAEQGKRLNYAGFSNSRKR